MGKPTAKFYEEIKKAFPRDLKVGDVCEFHPDGMLQLDGEGRWKTKIPRDHTRVVILGVPDNRSRNIRYRKLDPKPGGNGRRDRQVKRTKPRIFMRHYRPIAETLKATAGSEGK